jgi:hypothetical protein
MRNVFSSPFVESFLIHTLKWLFITFA